MGQASCWAAQLPGKWQGSGAAAGLVEEQLLPTGSSYSHAPRWRHTGQADTMSFRDSSLVKGDYLRLESQSWTSVLWQECWAWQGIEEQHGAGSP